MYNQPPPYTLNELLQEYSNDYLTSLVISGDDYGIPNRAL